MTDTLTWIDPLGNRTVLDDDELFVEQGIDGRGLPPVTEVADDVPGLDGSRLRSLRFGVRELAVPLQIIAADRDEIRRRVRSLTQAMNPKLGDGTFEVKFGDGRTRRLTCRYAHGLELAESGGNATRSSQKLLVVLRAHDPLWLGDPISVVWSLAASSPLFFASPFLGMHLSGGLIAGTATVQNAGDVDAYPVWTITGPGSNLALTKVATGEKLTLATIASGEVVTVDTRPGVRSVKSSTRGNVYGLLGATDVLWKLPPGASDVTFGMADASGSASVQLAYSPRYVSA